MQATKPSTAVDKADPNAVQIAKGVEYLKNESPKWSGEHNGDAMRALLAAGAKGYDVGSALDAALESLKQPAAWDATQRVSLTSALALAERAGKAAASALEAAAKLLTAEQKPDGSWQVEGPDSSVYGPILATWSARSSLIASGIQPDFFSIVQADRWIRGAKPENVLEAASTILALEGSGDVMADNLRRDCLSILRQGQAESGGWGVGVDGAPQIFNTALAVLALSTLVPEPRSARSAYTLDELKAAITNGKKYLVAQQKADGSWPQATPWALLALLQ